MGLGGFVDWVLEQAGYLLTIALVAGVIVCAYKRAWIMLGGVILGTSIIAIFVMEPDVINEIASFFKDKVFSA